MEVIESQRGEIYRAHQGDEQLRRDQLLPHEQLSEQNRDLREARIKSPNEMEELKQSNELTPRIQELQNEVYCMNDSRQNKDAESVRSGLSRVTSQPALLSLFRDPGGMLSRSVGMV